MKERIIPAVFLFFAVVCTFGVADDFVKHQPFPAGWFVTAIYWAMFYLFAGATAKGGK